MGTSIKSVEREQDLGKRAPTLHRDGATMQRSRPDNLRHPALLLLLPLLASLIIPSGCSTGPQAETIKAGDTPGLSGEGSNALDESTGDTLVSAVSTFADDTLDPKMSGAVNHGALLYPMYEQLATYDSQGGLVPQLAESWSVSPDGKVWSIKLRKGIRFHNGDEVTSADVKFSIESLTSAGARTAVAPALRPVIEKIETPGPFEVTITTRNVTTILMDLLVGGAVIMPAGYVRDKGEEYFAEHPVGTGPWRFLSHTPGAMVEFEAVKDHWRLKPAFKRLVIKLVPEESTRMAMLKRGEVDVINVTLDRIDELKAAGFEYRTAGYDSQPVIYLGGTWVGNDMPTQNIKVRQAMALAINREELAQTFFKGYATPSIRLKMGPGSFGWDPSWKPEPYDPVKARQLLAEAGYPGKYRDPVINLWSHQSQVWIPYLVQIVSGYWEAVGIRTRITPIDYATLRNMFIARPVHPKIVGSAYPFNEGAQGNPMLSILNAFGSTGVNANLNDPEWDALYFKVLEERDESKREELARQLMDKGYEHYSIILTVNAKQIYGVSNRIGEWRLPYPVVGLGSAYAGMQPR